MEKQGEVEVQDIDHLGIIAGIIDDADDSCLMVYTRKVNSGSLYN